MGSVVGSRDSILADALASCTAVTASVANITLRVLGKARAGGLSGVWIGRLGDTILKAR